MRDNENGENNQQNSESGKAEHPVQGRIKDEKRDLGNRRDRVKNDPRTRDERGRLPSSSGGTHARDLM